MANTKITSRVIADDAILTAHIADDQIASAHIADDVALGGNPTTTTQSAGNNTTRIATTAFVSTAVANIVNSAPSTLDTLGEIATALNNDAALNTTLTNSIATKLPLAGGTMSGNLVIADDSANTEKSLLIRNTTVTSMIGVEGSSANRFIGSAANNMFLGTTTADGIEFATNNNVRAVIDSSGNLVVGGTNVDAAGTVSLKSDGNIRAVGAANTAYDTIIGAISGVSNGFHIVQDSSNNQTYKFYNGGNPSLTIDSTGDLVLKGNGGDDALNIVHSGNTVKIVSIGQSSDNSGNGVIQLRRNNGVVHSQIHSHGDSYFNAGNVGIGNTTPSSAYSYADDLVVGNTSGAHGISIVTQNNTNGALHFTDALDNDDGAASYAGYLAYNHASNYMFFGVSSTERLRISSTGNTSIGTGTSTAPQATSYAHADADDLVIRSNDGNMGITLATDTDDACNIWFSDATSGAGQYAGFILYNHSDNRLSFGTNSNERIRIDSSGNVKMQSTASAAHANIDNLQIGNGAESAGMTVYSAAGSYGSVAFADGTSGTAQYSGLIEYYHNDNSMRFYANGTQHMKLNVHGQLKFTEKQGMMGVDPASDISCHAGANGGTSTKWRWGSNSNNTTAYFINHNNAGVYMSSGHNYWSAHSDERIKENIKDIGSVLDKVKNYRCVEFNLKQDTRKMYGFIAQDWETDFPYLVDEDTGFTIQSDGTLLGANEEGNTSTDIPKGIAYEETIPVLLKAIQEQQEQIETLKKEVEELKGG